MFRLFGLIGVGAIPSTFVNFIACFLFFFLRKFVINLIKLEVKMKIKLTAKNIIFPIINFLLAMEIGSGLDGLSA